MRALIGTLARAWTVLSFTAGGCMLALQVLTWLVTDRFPLWPLRDVLFAAFPALWAGLRNAGSTPFFGVFVEAALALPTAALLFISGAALLLFREPA